MEHSTGQKRQRAHRAGVPAASAARIRARLASAHLALLQRDHLVAQAHRAALLDRPCRQNVEHAGAPVRGAAPLVLVSQAGAAALLSRPLCVEPRPLRGPGRHPLPVFVQDLLGYRFKEDFPLPRRRRRRRCMRTPCTPRARVPVRRGGRRRHRHAGRQALARDRRARAWLLRSPTACVPTPREPASLSPAPHPARQTLPHAHRPVRRARAPAHAANRAPWPAAARAPGRARGRKASPRPPGASLCPIPANTLPGRLARPKRNLNWE